MGHNNPKNKLLRKQKNKKEVEEEYQKSAVTENISTLVEEFITQAVDQVEVKKVLLEQESEAVAQLELKKVHLEQGKESVDQVEVNQVNPEQESVAVDQLELKKVNLEQESIGKKRVGDMSEENRKRRKVMEEPASCKQAQRKETRGFVKDSKCLALDFHYDFEDSRYSGGSDYGSPLRSVTASPLRAGIDSPLYSSISSPAHVSQDQEAENG